MTESLEGKNILITGAAKRIGKSLALACAEAGANIVIHYGKSEQQARATQREITKTGRSAWLVQADLNQIDQVMKIIPQSTQNGPLYAVINNASVFAPITWETTTPQNWQYHMNVNLTAPFIISQTFYSSLPEEEKGRIINMLDWRSTKPGPDYLPYTISKAGLVAATKSLAVAFAPRVAVNGIALGAILAPTGSTELSDEKKQQLISKVPTGRWGTLEEVNNTALFLLTGPAYMTGEIIHLDGGRNLV